MFAVGAPLTPPLPSHRLFMTDLGGSVYAASLDGSEKRILLTVQGNLTGIAYAEMPSREH
jgi:hypothetical protein